VTFSNQFRMHKFHLLNTKRWRACARKVVPKPPKVANFPPTEKTEELSNFLTRTYDNINDESTTN
jgi:hypothetical protein